jgi:hypothetical protein
MTLKPYLEDQKFRAIEAAVRASAGMVPGVGFTLPLTLQLCIVAKANTAAKSNALTVNGRNFGAPAMQAGQVYRYDFFSKGSIASCAAEYTLAVNIGLGRYYKLDSGVVPPDPPGALRDSDNSMMLDENNSPLEA